jgi:hypothetical protein
LCSIPSSDSRHGGSPRDPDLTPAVLRRRQR